MLRRADRLCCFAVVADGNVKRFENALRIIFLALWESAEETFYLRGYYRRGLVDGLAFDEHREYSARGDTKPATGGEVGNVLDPVVGIDFEVKRVHVTAGIGETFAGRRGILHLRKAK